MKRVALVTVMAAVALFGPLAFAASAQTEVNVIDVASAVDEVWIIVAGILVMFMQAGFALVESGFTRAKNAGNIIMKNFMDFSVGAIVYWAFGFALAYGGTSVGSFFSTGNWFLSDADMASTWIFQVVFAATAATIVSGAMAERVKFSAYLIYSPFITGLIYPIVTHWVWHGDGWLTDLGAIDYLAVAQHFHTVILADVPTLGPKRRDEARRFMLLIDALYEHKVKIVISAEGPPEQLYPSGDGAFEFERTVSRLQEMRSKDYLELAHIG